jgi:hypothetical protein
LAHNLLQLAGDYDVCISATLRCFFSPLAGPGECARPVTLVTMLATSSLVLTRQRMRNAASPTRPSIAELVVAGQDRCGLREAKAHPHRAQLIYFLRVLYLYSSFRCVIRTSVNSVHLRAIVLIRYGRRALVSLLSDSLLLVRDCLQPHNMFLHARGW